MGNIAERTTIGGNTTSICSSREGGSARKASRAIVAHGEYIHQIVNDQRILNTPWANIRPIFHLWWPLMKIHSKNRYLILVRSKPVLLITIFLFLYSRNLPNVGSTYIVSLRAARILSPISIRKPRGFSHTSLSMVLGVGYVLTGSD